MAEFIYRKKDNRYKELYFQFPKVLFYGKEYKHSLSLGAKSAFMVLMEREEYSLRNNWVDEDDNIYFIFTNEELADLLDITTRTVIKIKKELENVNLLRQRKMGFNPKTGKNEPNRLYLGELTVNSTDVYLRGEYQTKTAQTLDNSGSENFSLPQETVKTLDMSGSENSARPHESANNMPQTLDNSGSENFSLDLYNTNNLDTNRDYKETAQLDFSQKNYSNTQIEKQNQDLVEYAYQFLTTDDEDSIPFEAETIRLLALWATSPQQLRRFIGIILNARRDVQEAHQDVHLSFILHDEPKLQAKITQTIRRYFNALRSEDKQIKNYENYLYITMKNMFENYGNHKLQQK